MQSRFTRKRKRARAHTSQRLAVAADEVRPGLSPWRAWELEPEAETARARRDVVRPHVGGRRRPKVARVDVAHQWALGAQRVRSEVVVEQVVQLGAVLNEKSVAADVEGDVVLNRSEVCAYKRAQ